MPGPYQLVVQRQPVVTRGLQTDGRWLGQVLQVIQQRTRTAARVVESTRLANLPPILAHETRLMRAFGDIDTHGDHERDLPSRFIRSWVNPRRPRVVHCLVR